MNVINITLDVLGLHNVVLLLWLEAVGSDRLARKQGSCDGLDMLNVKVMVWWQRYTELGRVWENLVVSRRIWILLTCPERIQMVLVKENQGVTWLTRFTWKIAVKMVCGYMCNNILLHQLQRRSAPPYGTVWLRKDFSSINFSLVFIV